MQKCSEVKIQFKGEIFKPRGFYMIIQSKSFGEEIPKLLDEIIIPSMEK